MQQFEVKFAILSIGAIHPNNGLMDAHLVEAEFSRTVMAQAEHTIVVADRSKFGCRGFVKVCAPDLIDTLITDCAPPPPFPERLKEAGVAVEIAASV